MKKSLILLCAMALNLIPISMAIAGQCASPPELAYFVRHATKVGSKDLLSTLGWNEAKKLANQNQLKEITQIYVTEKVRTKQTAYPLGQKTHPVWRHRKGMKV